MTATCNDLLPLQVAKVLVLLHSELLQGCTDTLDRLRRQVPSGTSGSQQQKVALCTITSVHTTRKCSIKALNAKAVKCAVTKAAQWAGSTLHCFGIHSTCLQVPCIRPTPHHKHPNNFHMCAGWR